MGLFKDFKEDFSQAVNELAPGEEEAKLNETAARKTVNTLGQDVDVKTELSKLDGLLEQVKEEPVVKPVARPVMPQMAVTEPASTMTMKEEKKVMSDIPVNETLNTQAVAPQPMISDETSVITQGTALTGDMQTTGSLDIQGTITGNVACNGKLVVTGTINGNSSSSEFFADAATIEGEVISSGTVKVGAGSVIIGNISATSAVIAGAVKGDIDVQGPVVVDTSAVIMGNIKSRSVQINNGAVIEGFCSQCYADVDIKGLFDAK